MHHSINNNENSTKLQHVCFYLACFGDGGVERMATNLAFGLSDLGIQVDFIVDKSSAPYVSIIEDKVNFIKPETHKNNAVDWLANYFTQHKPQIVMTVKDEDGYVAIKAIQQSGVNTKMVARTGTALKTRQKQRGMNPIKRWLQNREMHKLYRYQSDGHIVVAEGSKKELQEIIQVRSDNIIVIKNPVITNVLLEQQHATIPHPWFNDKSCPLIMGMGGFRTQKDFSTLIKAFAIAKKQKACRLLILGQGRQQKRLEKLCAKLNIQDDVVFPGFTDNPYPWLKRADLFVLSSLWEGSPNVLTESLALGTPVVSTDCMSGPRETLQDGRYGELVPMQDPQAMAQAMLRTLENPLPAETLKQAVQDYTVETSSKAYIKAFEFFLNQPKS